MASGYHPCLHAHGGVVGLFRATPGRMSFLNLPTLYMKDFHLQSFAVFLGELSNLFPYYP